MNSRGSVAITGIELHGTVIRVDGGFSEVAVSRCMRRSNFNFDSQIQHDSFRHMPPKKKSNGPRILSDEWRAEIDAKIALRAKRRAARYAKRPNADHRLVAWIDILGFGEELENANTPELLQAAYQKVLRVQDCFGFPGASDDAREQRETNKLYGRTVTAVSDALLVTARLSGAASSIMSPYDQLLSFIGELISAQAACALKGIFLRGGVCVGQFYHEKDILLSPALVHAHRLESKVAVHPVIIIEKDLVEGLQRLSGVEHYSKGCAPSLTYFRKFKSRKDPSRELFHLDYIRYIAEEDFGFFSESDLKKNYDTSLPPKTRDKIFSRSHDKKNVAALKVHRDHLVREFHAASDVCVKEKYLWLMRYQNKVLSRKIPLFQKAKCPIFRLPKA